MKKMLRKPIYGVLYIVFFLLLSEIFSRLLNMELIDTKVAILIGLVASLLVDVDEIKSDHNRKN